ncbi:hypothetical protein [Pseudomonas plecoglossicida]|uniref:hypothetical protein n=1 Tax=Pseudomonas plecoglossicida TaxID=70775 RepID=UPI00051CC795|nr:hypothetical protein [Pseudomonas plecoglossicida]KGK24274.1 hypothetical protein GT93_05205 [Pseudomonas plecoglossicida]
MHIPSEPEVERLLSRLQHIVERSPVHLRPKRRQIVRGMRAALAAMSDTPTLDSLRDSLLYELVGAVGEEQATSPREPTEYDNRRAARRQRIAQRLSGGTSPGTVAAEMGCSLRLVYRVRQTMCQSGTTNEVEDDER